MALDVGCGTERLMDMLKTHGFRTDGIDVSSTMLALARDRYSEARLFHADICGWELPQTCDLIVAWDSVWHVPLTQQEAVLTKLCRGLAAGGFSCSPRAGRTSRTSGIAGRGLYANGPIVRGEIVSVKGGHLIGRATLERNKAVVKDADMQIADDLFLAPLSSDEFERVMMFLNHSCEPNVGVQGQIVFVAMRDVAAGEELTLDYGTIDHDAEPMACRCGAASCRGTITGEDWRRPDL